MHHPLFTRRRVYVTGLIMALGATCLLWQHQTTQGLKSPTAQATPGEPKKASPGVENSSLSAATEAFSPALVVAEAEAKESPAKTAAVAPVVVSSEWDINVNPYAAALRENGKSKRSWDPAFIESFKGSKSGDAVRFELTNGVMAQGTVNIVTVKDDQVIYVSGELSAPEAGKFFVLAPPKGGKAGSAVAVVEFPESKTAYRVEPTGNGGAPELWQRRLDEVICGEMAHADPKMVEEANKAAAAGLTGDPANLTPVRPDSAPNYTPASNANIVSLQSYPGSPAVLYLDFAGGYTDSWGGATYTRPPIDNDAIRDICKRVAEDFMPFNINVTTDLKVFQAAAEGSRQRCCFGQNTVTDVGVAYIGSWNWGGDTVCWSAYYGGKAAAEVGAHEPGHTLGLGHQGQDIPNGSGGTNRNEYYGGHGSGETGWAPIMGVGYYQPVTTWAKGEFQYAYNPGDALAAIVTNNNVHYRSDDTGSTLATSRYLDINADNSVRAEGVIEQTADADAFQFTTTGGQISLTAHPVAQNDWANMGLSVSILNASNTVLQTNNDANQTAASITTTLAAGTYTVRVTGAGKGSPLTDGFSSYASLGYYYITGSVAGARQPTRLSVVERAANNTVVGNIAATNPNSSTLVYSIVGGNTGGTFSVDNTGVVRVANNALLDYYALAANTSAYGARFELFVNIQNTGNSSYSETNRRVVIDVKQFLAPVPTGLTVTPDSGMRLSLAWSGSGEATSYNVKRSSTPGGPYTTIGGTIGTSFADTGMPHGVTYYYVVSAVNANGESANSAEAGNRGQALGGFSFETPVVGGHVYSPTGGIWAFGGTSGNGSGVLANGSAFGNPNAPDGRQAAFLQGTSTVSQTIAGFVPGTTYVVNYAAAQRSGSAQHGGQTWNVTLDGNAIQTNNTPGSTRYAPYSVTFVATASTHTLGFAGTNLLGDDNTVFIDNFQITLAAPTITNAGFETPSLGSGHQYNPTGASWIFNDQVGNGGSGIAANGSAFGVNNAPMGTQVGFVQSTGSIRRTLTGFVVGQPYTLTYAAAQRPQNNQSWDVKLDNLVIQSNEGGGSAFTTYSVNFVATATSHTLWFAGTNLAGGDNTVFIDNVSIISPPQFFAAPSVALTNPAHNATYTTTSTINMTASVTTNGNQINGVHFYADGINLLGTDNTAPYTYAWSGGGTGKHEVFARVLFNNGSYADSQAVRIGILNSNQNLSFESPSVNGYQYTPGGGSWNFVGGNGSADSGSGIVANGGGFNNPSAPAGTQAAFLQSFGKFSQTLGGFVPGKSYTLTYYAAQRTSVGNGGESWDVLIDDKVISSNMPGSGAYASYSATFTARAPFHTLAFVGTNLSGRDNTVFIDRIALVTRQPLTLTSSTTPAALAQGTAGAASFAVTNPDTLAAPNVEMTLTFPAGTAPDTLTMPGWIVEPRGTGVWALRNESLAAAATGTATANWASMPMVDAIPIATTVLADSSPLVVSQITLNLASSYAAWAAGLSDPAQGADPDGDGVTNLMEYALGGDPRVADLMLPGSQPMLPRITRGSGGNFDFSFPKRTDAVARGLSYIIETSTDMVTWTAAQSSGGTSSAAELEPVVSGFTLQHWTWTQTSAPAYYVRLRVELSETP